MMGNVSVLQVKCKKLIKESIDHLRAFGSIAEDVDSLDEQQTV